MDIFDCREYDSLPAAKKKALDLFVHNGFDERAAAKGARMAHSTFRNFLATPRARRILKEYTDFLINKKKDTLSYRIIDIYTTRAFYNPGEIIDGDGYLKVNDLKDLGTLAFCVEGIETDIKGVTIINKGRKDEKAIKLIKKKVKLCDREKALEQLARFMELMTDKVELTGPGGGPLQLWNLTRTERKQRLKDLLKKQQKGK